MSLSEEVPLRNPKEDRSVGVAALQCFYNLVPPWVDSYVTLWTWGWDALCVVGCGSRVLCSILHSVPCPWLGFFRLRYSVLCVCVLPLVVCLDVPFIAGMVSWVPCLCVFMPPPRPLGGSFGCSYAPCLTIHWSSSSFESVMVSLLEFSIVMGYRVKVSFAWDV